MEHHHHHHQNMHWGYSTPPVPTQSTPSQNQWATPAQSHSLKRRISESDCDDLYSEESSKEQISPSNPGSCQLMSRKKRRGVIEKKRRDRINSSLSELKRLVPSAYEKQGSAKLEKAEILQLTVEHLKNLHSKGMDALSYDPQRFAMDYHIIGFRECAAEVARYLVTCEGMDIQDPLRLRLMSHLQYFVQQREISAKSCVAAGSGTWPAASTGAYQPNCAVAPYQSYSTPTTVGSHSAASTSSYVPNLPASLHPYPSLSASPNATHLHHQHHQQSNSSVHVGRSSTGSTTSETIPINHQHTSPPHSSQSRQTSAQVVAHPQTTPTPHDNHHSQQQQQQQQQQHYSQDHALQDHQGATYIELTSQSQHHSRATAASGNISYTAASGQYGSQDYNANGYVTSNGSKPYRPWGAEMAY